MARVVSSLKKDPVSVANTQGLELLDACYYNIDFARYLIREKKYAINWQDDDYGNSLIHYLVFCDNMPALVMLYSFGIDINVVNNNFETPLHWAARLNFINCGTWLCMEMKSLDASDISGSSPLHIAAQNGNPEFVSLLLRHKIDVQLRDKDGFQAIELVFNKRSENHRAIYILLKRYYIQNGLKFPNSLTAFSSSYTLTSKSRREHGAVTPLENTSSPLVLSPSSSLLLNTTPIGDSLNSSNKFNGSSKSLGLTIVTSPSRPSSPSAMTPTSPKRDSFFIPAIRYDPSGQMTNIGGNSPSNSRSNSPILSIIPKPLPVTLSHSQSAPTLSSREPTLGTSGIPTTSLLSSKNKSLVQTSSVGASPWLTTLEYFRQQYPCCDYVPWKPSLVSPSTGRSELRHLDLFISLEHCSDCHLHTWSLWHNSQKYRQSAESILNMLFSLLLDLEYPGRVVCYLAKAEPSRLGALEATMYVRVHQQETQFVGMENQKQKDVWIPFLLYSKLSSLSWPSIGNLRKKASEFFEAIKKCFCAETKYAHPLFDRKLFQRQISQWWDRTTMDEEENAEMPTTAHGRKKYSSSCAKLGWEAGKLISIDGRLLDMSQLRSNTDEILSKDLENQLLEHFLLMKGVFDEEFTADEENIARNSVSPIRKKGKSKKRNPPQSPQSGSAHSSPNRGQISFDNNSNGEMRTTIHGRTVSDSNNNTSTLSTTMTATATATATAAADSNSPAGYSSISSSGASALSYSPTTSPASSALSQTWRLNDYSSPTSTSYNNSSFPSPSTAASQSPNSSLFPVSTLDSSTKKAHSKNSLSLNRESSLDSAESPIFPYLKE